MGWRYTVTPGSRREPEDKNLDLQVDRLVRAGCAMGNVRAEEASGAKDDRGGLLELLDLVVEGDTLVVTHIDRLSRGLTYGLQVIEGLHRAGVEFGSLAEDFDTATSTGKFQLSMVFAFSEWWRELDQGPLGRWPGQGTDRGQLPRPEAQPQRAATGVHPGGTVEGSEPAGTGQAPGGQPMDHPTGGRVGVGWKLQPLQGTGLVGSLTRLPSKTPQANGPDVAPSPCGWVCSLVAVAQPATPTVPDRGGTALRSLQPALRALVHPGHHQPPLRWVDRGVRL